MEQIDSSLIVGIIVTLLFSAFFSGMEIAFVSGNRMMLEMDKDRLGIQKKIIDVFYAHSNNFVSTLLVGNNIALVIYGILIAKLFDSTIFRNMDAGFTVPADTIISTLIVLFTGEFLPKVISKSKPNRMLTFFAVPTLICYIVLWPLARFTTLLSHLILRITGVKIEKDTLDNEFSKVDLDYLVQSSIDNASEDSKIRDEVKIFQNALDFSDVKVRDCMVPRTEICAVGEDCKLSELKSTFIESGKSKIVVYKDDIDHIIGYIHSSEMFDRSAEWRSRVRSMPFVPETMSANRLMKIFMQQKKTLAVVVDEFGGTSGIVSLEDLVEEIFGDIEDEHDNSNYTAVKTGEGEYVLSARLEIDKINEMFGLDLPESEDYMTLGGLILHEYQSFPKLNEVIKIGHWDFKIIKNTATKIELVRLKTSEKS
ncbi:MAG: hemolysin family protein [Prevotella sp.]